MTDPDKNARDQLVQSQYESYPYPERDPDDEKKRLIAGSPSNLFELNYYVFGGARDLSKPLKALVAGGGTGDAVIMLAQHMRDAGVPGEVVHLDLSGPSQAVAQARAKIRGLENIRFVTGSLLDIAEVAPGPWDYIDCCGVLHHLEDPDAGLTALAGQLAPDGGIGVMVYGEYGRTGVYHMQDMLRAIAPGGEMPDEDRVAMAKRLAENLPKTSWINRNGLIRDHVGGGDPGVYDLFLHSRDRAYTVPDIADFVTQAGLRLTSFIESYRYDPDWLVRDPRILKRLRDLDPIARASFAELFTGNLKKHIFYAVRDTNPVSLPGTDDPRVIPHLLNQSAEEAGKTLPPGGKITVTSEGLKTDMPVPALSRPIAALCDGKHSLAEIHAKIQEKRADLDYDAFKRQFDDLYRVMNAINRMVLRLPV
ncbi:MAG: methyltransferase [Rhodospirillaceae bacterium]|jgi:SAM-dependent methyltransferase|nr:methyltransferase [Rhodospirillaceae bacterium]MBT5945059.1 methyltransferase [Rhodospirillaceae bacterium]MBT6402860.1 methyltransferase [Rhodospirillaceae bacterium]MBT6535752.1 methyltransferase [Rhodospirillaceae bacterium]MBT7360767.1 methyltransferase [Rhodospirillaceae bacterium]